jgi:hypothetical protein
VISTIQQFCAFRSLTNFSDPLSTEALAAFVGEVENAAA